jgi:tetratricopeptide (TPR) repeat protein
MAKNRGSPRRLRAFRCAARAHFFAVVVIVAFCSHAPLVGQASGAEHSPDSDRMAASIGERLAKLAIHPNRAESVSEKALRARRAIKTRDYPAAREIIAAVLRESRLQNWRYYPFEAFVKGISDTQDSAFEERLSEWADRDKSDAIPVLIRAQFYIDLAWAKRGRKFVQETTGDKLAVFTTYTTRALAEVNKAIKLNDQIPYAFWLRLRIFHGFGRSKDLLAAFEDAAARYPDYYSLYEIVLSTLEPRWGGTIAEMYSFVERYAGPAPQHSPLKLLYLSLYRSLLSSAWINCNSQSRNKDKLAECIVSFMGQTITPALERQVQEALRLYDHSDHYQFNGAIDSIIGEVLDVAGGETYSGAILELAAIAMHSSTQLEPDTPERNNYVIDKAVAESWFRKGFYDNALKKYQQSLRDIDHAPFPSPEEKDAAVAGIYDRLARTHSSLHQHVDTIVYEKAAVMLGAKTGNEHLICYGYYRLKLFDEAVGACSEAVDDADNMHARYWRGRAYQDLGKLEAALPDFAAIADSDHGFRTQAAISMSLIHQNLKDYRRSLEVLNKYTFLYDATTQNKNNIAASYNNRCSAYMQLGELKRALEDCTASLKYGSIPDAYRKQQELVKRLKAPDKDL